MKTLIAALTISITLTAPAIAGDAVKSDQTDAPRKIAMLHKPLASGGHMHRIAGRAQHSSKSLVTSPPPIPLPSGQEIMDALPREQFEEAMSNLAVVTDKVGRATQ